MDNWIQFFLRAGIPNGVANRYAKAFTTNRISKEMLPDLDKATLIELGVTAIGDQLAILRRVKDSGNALVTQKVTRSPIKAPTKQERVRISAPGEGHSHSKTASELRRGKPPPDRHEIYHVTMPRGNTHRTRKILEHAETMREMGLAVRGTTGVRQGGRSVSPIDKSSTAARLMRKQNSEVSSSSDHRMRRLGIQGMHSDKMNGVGKIQRIATSRITKKTASGTVIVRPGAFGRAVTSAVDDVGSVRARVSLTNPPRNTVLVGRGGSGLAGRMKTSGGRQIVVTTANSRKNNGIRLVTDEEEYEYMEDEVQEEDDEMEDIDDLELLDEEEDVVEYEDEDDIIDDVGVTSSVRNRISYANGRNGGNGGGGNRGGRGVQARLGGRPTVIQHRNDSVFNRVSFQR